MAKWKEVKANKDYQCYCCGGHITKGENHLTETSWEEGMFPTVNRFCEQCGPLVKGGLSFRQTRIKAFGSPLLRGWRYPDGLTKEAEKQH